MVGGAGPWSAKEPGQTSDLSFLPNGSPMGYTHGINF